MVSKNFVTHGFPVEILVRNIRNWKEKNTLVLFIRLQKVLFSIILYIRWMVGIFVFGNFQELVNLFSTCRPRF